MKLVFDLGATHTRLALTDGHQLSRAVHLATDTSRHGLETLVTQIKKHAAGEQLTAVAGGVPGQVEASSGRLVHAPNLAHWLDLPVQTRLEEALGTPVYLQNDTALGGLGEAIYGAGSGQRIVVYVTVSTGVNGVRIVDGRIEPSAYGFEIGAQLLPDGKSGASLESLTGGAAMAARHHHAPREVHGRAVWQEEARHLAHGLYNTILHWSPDVVVLGGSMMRDIDLADISAELAELPQPLVAWPPLKRAELDQDTGLYGAMAYLETI